MNENRLPIWQINLFSQWNGSLFQCNNRPARGVGWFMDICNYCPTTAYPFVSPKSQPIIRLRSGRQSHCCVSRELSFSYRVITLNAIKLCNSNRAFVQMGEWAESGGEEWLTLIIMRWSWRQSKRFCKQTLELRVLGSTSPCRHPHNLQWGQFRPKSTINSDLATFVIMTISEEPRHYPRSHKLVERGTWGDWQTLRVEIGSYPLCGRPRKLSIASLLHFGSAVEKLRWICGHYDCESTC